LWKLNSWLENRLLKAAVAAPGFSILSADYMYFCLIQHISLAATKESLHADAQGIAWNSMV